MSGHCFYCDTPVFKSNEKDNMATRDHILPIKLGGGGWSWKHPNIVLCCRRCNNLKADKHPKDWYPFIKDAERRAAFVSRLCELFPRDILKLRKELKLEPDHDGKTTPTKKTNRHP